MIIIEYKWTTKINLFKNVNLYHSKTINGKLLIPLIIRGPRIIPPLADHEGQCECESECGETTTEASEHTQTPTHTFLFYRPHNRA